jgi:hypothetical protein
MNLAKDLNQSIQEGFASKKTFATLGQFRKLYCLTKDEAQLVLEVSLLLRKGGAATQLAHLFAWLSVGRSITALQALEEFGCARLAARIHNLRSQGYGIADEFIETNTGKRVKQYWLDRKG